MTQLTLSLRHRKRNDRPYTIPRSRLLRPKRHNPPRRLPQQRHRMRTQPVVGIPSTLRRHQQPALRQPIQRRPRTGFTDLKLSQQINQSRRGQMLRTSQPVVTKECHQQVLRSRPHLGSRQPTATTNRASRGSNGHGRHRPRNHGYHATTLSGSCARRPPKYHRSWCGRHGFRGVPGRLLAYCQVRDLFRVGAFTGKVVKAQLVERSG